MTQVCILADDLTGAADSAAPFAARGRECVLGLLPRAWEEVEVFSLALETRRLPPPEAGAAVRGAFVDLQGLFPQGFAPLYYKKMDSMLRGSPGVELGALMDAGGLRRALVCPAFPEQGRVTRAGRQVIHSEALEPGLEQLFAPCERPLLRIGLDLLRQGPGSMARALQAVGEGVWIADAETRTDLNLLAESGLASGIQLYCGSAGLSGGLAHSAYFPGNEQSGQERKLAAARGPVLVVAGSRSPQMAVQVAEAQESGMPVFYPSQTFFEGGAPALEDLFECLSGALRDGRDSVAAACQSDPIPGGDAAIAARLGELTRRLVLEGRVGGLVLSGGETARAVCTALELECIRLYGEAAPGMPLARLGGLPLVLKAGSFGAPNALVEAARVLKRGG